MSRTARLWGVCQPALEQRLASPHNTFAESVFDRAWYIRENPDLDQKAVDPLIHYLHLGGFEGRDPHPLFDSDWYLTQYEDVAERGINPLAHYLKWGAAQGRNPHPLFDTAFYLRQKPN